MGYQHVKDIVASVEWYTDKQTGDLKSKSLNVGKIMRNEQGREFMVLSRSFNPAGVVPKPGEEVKADILLSLFDPKPKDGQQQRPAQAAPAAKPAAFDDRAIPF